MFINKRKQYRLKSDEELVTLHKSEGGSICIGILYERYGHLVIGACMKYLKNTVEAEDMTMHIFENLGQKLLKHEIQYFKSWLYIVTKNECFMSLRKKGYEFSSVEITTIKEEESDLDKILLKEQKISLITMSAIILFFILKKFDIRLFHFFGLYAYEIYLIHWPLMSRYDISFQWLQGWIAVILYLGLFLIIALIINKILNLIYRAK